MLVCDFYHDVFGARAVEAGMLAWCVCAQYMVDAVERISFEGYRCMHHRQQNGEVFDNRVCSSLRNPVRCLRQGEG